MDAKLQCLIIDDELAEGMFLRSLIEKTDFLQFDRLINDPTQAFVYLQSATPDLLFLDVEMPQMSGIELLKSLKNPPNTILVTSHTDFALEAYDLDVIDYLIKPVEYARFLKAVGKITELHKSMHKSKEDRDILIKVDNKYIRLEEKEITYIEALKDYIVVHTDQNRQYITYATLKYIEEQLKILFKDKFKRIHRSYIVNIGKIDFVEEMGVVIMGKTIPIGATYKSDFISFINKI